MVALVRAWGLVLAESKVTTADLVLKSTSTEETPGILSSALRTVTGQTAQSVAIRGKGKLCQPLHARVLDFLRRENSDHKRLTL